MTEPLSVVVLAAGKGTRMRNELPKVLHPLAGLPLIAHVLRCAGALQPRRICVVLGPGMDAVAAAVRSTCATAEIVIQEPQLGTGHALQVARPALAESGSVLVLYGDTPLVTPQTCARLLAMQRDGDAAMTVLAMRPPDPSGYGRLRFEGGQLVEIVEERHADEALRVQAPCNSGLMALDAARLTTLLEALPLRPGKNEIYLTDVVAAAVARGWGASAVEGDWIEGQGVNSQAQLAAVEELLQARLRASALYQGVIMPAPHTVHLAYDTSLASGAMVEPYVVFGPGVRVETGAVIHSFSHLEGARIGAHASVGPFARLRPGTELGEAARVGNFVEAKAAYLGAGAKANHLSYVGDAHVGAGANVGAGTITCNYDGFAKHRTVIGERAFIGSNSALVAPVTIGASAIVAAGSTVTEDVPDNALAIARQRQEIRPGQAEKVRQRKALRRKS
jgi:bifunctional UDP-N-acetylglucosamine pyrophosphorylase/glucosamine-1-phosphate N-acetyltransferase